MEIEKIVLTAEEKQHRKTNIHRQAVKRWKANHRDQHLEHRKKEYQNKKIKFIFLNILLE
jgi:hypothetical protein